MMIYGVYRNTNTEECEFVGNAKEVAEFIGTTPATVLSMVTRQNIVRKKYKIRRIYYEKQYNIS